MNRRNSEMNENLTEKTKETHLIYDGRILHLYCDSVTLPDGGEATREYCRHNGGVCIIPVTDNGEVVCVEQYRYPHNEITLEIPAGKLESKDIDHKAAALRELKEETGAECDKLTYLGKIYPSPAISDEIIHIYMAQGLHFGDKRPDADEFIETEIIPISRLLKMINEGMIPDAKTQIAVLRANEILKAQV